MEGSLVNDDEITKDLEGSSLDVINVRIQSGSGEAGKQYIFAIS